MRLPVTSEPGLKILMLTLFVPHREVGHGAATVDSHYVQYFSREHDLTVAAFTFSKEEAALARQVAADGIDLRTVPFPDGRRRRAVARALSLAGRRPFMARLFDVPAMRALLAQLFREKTFDIVQIETCFLGEYADAIPATTATVLMELDVSVKPLARRYRLERSRLKRAWHRHQWLQMREYEPRLCRQFDRVYAVSEEDRALIGELADRTDVGVFRYGADPGLLRLPLKPRNDRSVLFLGAFLHKPNVDAVEWFGDAVLPLLRRDVPDVTFRCIGRNPPRSVVAMGQRPGVQVLGFVPDLHEELARADVGVVPLLSGGGVKLKTLELLAAGRAVVTTPIGVEGIDARDGEHLLVARTAEEFAARVTRLLTDDQLRRRLAARGRELVFRDHQWEANLAALERDYLALAGRAAAPQRSASAV
jgi:glycosyltransferase involved in cell wall biosynthesis